LNNDAISKLVKAGLSDELIVSTVNSQPGSYDTSVDGLVALKTAGVSDKVVTAIVAKASASSSTLTAHSESPSSGSPIASVEAAQSPVATPAPAVQGTALYRAEPGQPSNKPRLYLESASKGSNRNAARDQSMEMSKDFEKDCPEVRMTINSSMADYTILLNHIEHGLLVRDNQIQIANKDGDLISRTKEGGSIRGDVKRACEIILGDWAKKR
jgi:hypothetical protein